MSVPIDRDETGRSKQPYALNRARGAHRAGGTAGATTRRDGSRGTSAIAREDKRSRHSRVDERRTILAVRSCLCQRSARLDARRRAERSLPWYGRRARESSRRFGRSTLARESSSVGRQPNAAHPRGDLWVSVARATSTRARAGRSRQQTGDLRVHTRGTLFQDWMSYECVIFGGGAPSAGEFFFSPPAMGLSSSGESPGWGRVLCFQRSFAAHSTRARIFANAPRRLDRGPRERTSIPQRIHPGDKRSQTRCVRPREAVEVSEAAAEDSAVVARREAEGDSAAAAAAAAAAASTKDLRIPSSVRDVRPARVVPRVSARARTQREHAPNCWFTLGFVVAGFFPPGGGGAPHSFAHPRRHPSSHLPQRSASSCTRARARPCASSPTPRYVPSASNPARHFAPGKAHHRRGVPVASPPEKGHPPRRRAPPPSASLSIFANRTRADTLRLSRATSRPRSQVPYFNGPIFLENKTQVGKVEEIFGPINASMFTIKMAEGVVASSYSKGDKFHISPDKLLPMERFLPQKGGGGGRGGRGGGRGGRGGGRGGRGGRGGPGGRGGGRGGGRFGGGGGRGGGRFGGGRGRGRG